MRLTRDEIMLIAAILTALVVGATVKHYRDAHRMHPKPAALPPANRISVSED